MCSHGDEWQARLESHFRALADRRADGRTVFALEHGLTADELRDLRDLVAATIGSPIERTRHWLPIVVHAAEVAYEYAGDEYWPSFSAKTPGWSDSQTSRHEIRDACRRFAQLYRGPTPHGRWADWFTIICWPIANAILPTDLQRQLARALFVAGPGLAKHLDDIEQLGRYVAASAWEGSDRFQQLREQPVFLGQIALALLRPQATSDTLLLESTLRRIARDLESERSAASWIRSARGAINRPDLRLTGTRVGGDGHPTADLEEQVERLARLTSPEVFLRLSSEGEWTVWLALPNLAPLADLSPVVRQSLLESKSWAPAADTPIARGRLLFAEQEIKLTRWPNADAPLVRFQGLAAGLEAALLRAWTGLATPAVFRVRSDGTARRVISRAVRGGQSYLVAHEKPPDGLRDLPNRTNCAGVHVSVINVPDVIDQTTKRALQKVGCLPAQSAAIWPAASIPVLWDGEGSVEWLTTDSPVLGVAVDHELRELTLSMQGGAAASTGRLPAGATVFIALPHLAEGMHELLVRETPVDGPQVTRALLVGIREPKRATSTAGPIRMWAEPYSTDLGHLWSGQTAVCIAGPARTAELTFTLSARPAGDPSASIRMPLTVPLSGPDWRMLLTGQVQEDEGLVAAYDNARWARVEVDADRFGIHSLEFERALPPLRWGIERQQDAYVLTLHDDGEGVLPPEVSVASFERPDVLEPLGRPQLGSLLKADHAGGLYLARRASDVAAIVVPPLQRVFHSLEDLRREARFGPVPADPAGVRRHLELLGAWSRATLPGHPLAAVWRAQAIRGIQAALVKRFAGQRWASGELAVLEHRTLGSLRALEHELSSPSGTTTSHARAVMACASEMRGWSVERRIETFKPMMTSANLFADQAWSPIAKRRGPHAAEWASEFFLRLATDPDVDAWAGSAVGEGVGLAIAWPLPTRLARYVALSTVVGTSGPLAFPPLFEGWSWR